MLLRQCNLATIKTFCGQLRKKGTDARMEINKFYCCKGVLRNNYQSYNLIGHYPFWVISPRNSTSFTRPFLAGRHAWAGHEIKENPQTQFDSHVPRSFGKKKKKEPGNEANLWLTLSCLNQQLLNSRGELDIHIPPQVWFIVAWYLCTARHVNMTSARVATTLSMTVRMIVLL